MNPYVRIRSLLEEVCAETGLPASAAERVIAGACGALKRELVALERDRDQLTLGSEIRE